MLFFSIEFLLLCTKWWIQNNFVFIHTFLIKNSLTMTIITNVSLLANKYSDSTVFENLICLSDCFTADFSKKNFHKFLTHKLKWFEIQNLYLKKKKKFFNASIRWQENVCTVATERFAKRENNVPSFLSRWNKSCRILTFFLSLPCNCARRGSKRQQSTMYVKTSGNAENHCESECGDGKAENEYDD